ncbi:MAG: tryptophan-rich sensory protein [Myxococcota bacterium]
MSPTISRLYAVTNAIVTALVIGWNYWTSVYGFAGNKVGEMSDRYDTLFTPAGYAFSIWGIIFLGLLVHAGYQLWLAFRGEDPDFFRRLGPWLILTNLANGAWVVAWLTEFTGLSVLILASMFVFLSIAMWRLDMETWDAPFRIIALVWWPLAIYAGWVTVAVLANLSAYLSKTGIVPGTSATWAIAMIAIATGVNVVLIWRRNLREHALVAVWALAAIAVRQWGETPSVQWTATGCAALLLVLIAGHAVLVPRTAGSPRPASAPHLPQRARRRSTLP